MLEKHEGGEKFFDNLDSKLQNKVIINELLVKIYDSGIEFDTMIVSGGFGNFFCGYIGNNGTTINHTIRVNGGLRKGEPIKDLTDVKDKIENKNVIFIDDSFYSGMTRSAIYHEIERLGGKLVATFVIYDGSMLKLDAVHSLYRYHD